MTLATRLILLVAGALLVSLLVGGVLVTVAASHLLQSDVDTAAGVARELVDQRLTEAAEEAESPERLSELLRSLEAGYHVKAVYLPDGIATGSPQVQPSSPDVVSRLLGVHPIVQNIPVSLPSLLGGHIELAADPGPAVKNVEHAIELSVAAIALFSCSTLVLVALGLTRSLRPLQQLAAAFSRVGAGDYSLRIAPRGPREIALLKRQFNSMADQLQQIQGRARALDAQMLAVQKRERREIARDLHDELGPCLLAANLDVSALIRLNRTDDRDAIGDCAAGLADVLAEMQALVRRMISRLHLTPDDAVEFAAGVDNIVGFWRDRCPEIEWVVDCPDWRSPRPAATSLALLRVVQEALANAVRHSGARRITVTCKEQGATLVLTVADNGIGLVEPPRQGLGLSGMRGRVAALGGVMEVTSPDRNGTRITARIPSPTPASALTEEVIEEAYP